MSVNAPLWVVAPAILVAAVATGADVRTRKIPNRLTGPALLVGVALHWALGGLGGAGNALLGALIAGALLLPGWLMGWMAAGDVKLVAAVGAFLGYPQSLMMVLLSLMAGGVLALVEAVRRGVLVQSIRGAALLGAWAMTRTGRTPPPPVTSGVRFPFALAVLTGVVCSLWVGP
jgi:prepilin peptidase CpaA